MNASPYPSLTPTDRRHLLWFFLIALLVLGAGYGLRDPWPADEPRFVLVAKQMVESGDFLFPHRGSELYPDKPPLFFWLLSAAFGLIGSWRWSFLLPSLLAGLGTLWLTYDLGRRLWNPRVGLWAAGAVLISVQFVYQFKRAQIDPTLIVLTTLAFYGLCRHLLLGPSWRWYSVAGLAAGLGVIAKGVGFLPLLALLPYAAMVRGHWRGLAPIPNGNGFRWGLISLGFLGAIALWLVPVVMATYLGNVPERHDYLQNILFKQTAQRYIDPWGHNEPGWYFLQVVAMFWAPFSLALPWLLKPWREAWQARDARVWLPLAWVLLVVLFFSLSEGKRDMYILPALPALALAAAPFLGNITQRVGLRRAVLTFTFVLFAVLLSAGLLALTSEPSFEKRLLSERGIGDSAHWLWWMLIVVGAAGVLAALVGRVRNALPACAFSLALVWIGYGLVVHPVLDDDNSSRAVMHKARQAVGDAVVIGLVDWKEQNLLQAIGPVTDFGFLQPPREQLARAMAWLQTDPEQRRVLLQTSAELSCVTPETDGVWLGVANRRSWWLVGPKALSNCDASASTGQATAE